MITQKLSEKLYPWSVGFYPDMAALELEKAFELEPYTGRRMADDEHMMGFVVNADGMVLPTTRKPLWTEANQLAPYGRRDDFFNFGGISVNHLAAHGVTTPHSLLEYAKILTQLVQSDKENYLCDYGAARIVQNNALPALK